MQDCPPPSSPPPSHRSRLHRWIRGAALLAVFGCSGPKQNPPRPETTAGSATAAGTADPIISGGTAPAAPAGTAAGSGQSKPLSESARYVREHYAKREARIPMRDGVNLFTSIYAPKDASIAHPILLCRTPYSCSPYGEGELKESVGPSDFAMRDGFIFVYQDVRGCYMSEGEFVDVRPHVEGKTGKAQVDESTDCYDTIDWLLANVPGHNGKVGMWGISYPGFYAAASMIDHHPALAAVSPQAPIADWFFDDFHHHGTLFLPHGFNFLSSFGQPRPEPTTKRPERFKHPTPDGYAFFLGLGPLASVNDRYFKGGIKFWNDLVLHPNYDAFWEARNLRPHLRNVAPAVLTVGGWFDAEDLFGALHVYSSVEAQNPGIFNALVMGPWQHGGWARTDGDRLGGVRFGEKTSLYYREKVELAFFDRFLKGTSVPAPAEATVFETGANRWRTFDHWPPNGIQERVLYAHAGPAGSPIEGLSPLPPDREEAIVDSFEPSNRVGGTEDWCDPFTSDPDRPVPYTEAITTGMTREYMTDDQRFAARRPDVVAYQTEPLEADLTFAGPIQAELWVSTSGTDSDWIVKLIDVFPDDAPSADETPDAKPDSKPMGGYQMMVRSEAFRGRFRESYSQPKPFVKGEPTKVAFPLQDVLHTFKKGHRAMVQIQCTWFPLVDRNPQTYVDNIFEAKATDFRAARQAVYRSKKHPTCIRFGALPN